MDRRWLDSLLDRSIAASFDRTGYRRHARHFGAITPRPLRGTTLITGGTAGLGLGIADALADQGASTVLWGRSEARGAEVVAARPGRRFQSVDLGDLDTVAAAARQVEGPLDAVVLNAGAMPLERALTPQGHELVWASQVLGHLLLLRILRERGLLSPTTRVVWMASGGMYAQRLDLRDLRWDGGYQRHTVYANAKRAQVMINAALATRWPEVWTAAMHPGWVDTGGVAVSMPLFYRVTRPWLRSVHQGADTAVWLVVASDPGDSGQFWFDRSVQPVHLRSHTRASDEQRDDLMDLVFSTTDPWVTP